MPWPRLPKIPLALVVAMLAAAPATAFAARGVQKVEIHSDRVLLGDLVPNAPGQIAGVDLGPAPAPGKSRTIKGQQIRQRLRQAMVDHIGLAIPRLTRVRRPGRKLSALDLQRLVRHGLESQLPPGATILRVRVNGGQVLPRGELVVQIEPMGSWRDGANTLRVGLRVGDSARRTIPAVVDLRVPKRRQREIVVRRGDQVAITARAPGLVLRTRGEAQRDGALGDLIPVVPRVGRRILQARVSGNTAVEVDL